MGILVGKGNQIRVILRALVNDRSPRREGLVIAFVPDVVTSKSYAV